MRARYLLLLALLVPVLGITAGCSPFYGPYDRPGYGEHVSVAEVHRALERNEHVDAGDIRVDTRGSTVYLSGTVSSDHQREEAYRAARSVRGVREVVMDRLYVEGEHYGYHERDYPG